LSEIDDLVQKLRAAADQLEAITSSNSTEEMIKIAAIEAGGPQSCCGDCTGVSPLPPCSGACIKVSPLM
jgi:hypothetical protein